MEVTPRTFLTDQVRTKFSPWIVQHKGLAKSTRPVTKAGTDCRVLQQSQGQNDCLKGVGARGKRGMFFPYYVVTEWETRFSVHHGVEQIPVGPPLPRSQHGA